MQNTLSPTAMKFVQNELEAALAVARASNSGESEQDIKARIGKEMYQLAEGNFNSDLGREMLKTAGVYL